VGYHKLQLRSNWFILDSNGHLLRIFWIIFHAPVYNRFLFRWENWRGAKKDHKFWPYYGLIIMHLLKLMCLLVAVFSHYYRERTDKTIFGASSKYSLCAKNKKKKAKNTKTVWHASAYANWVGCLPRLRGYSESYQHYKSEIIHAFLSVLKKS